MSDCLHTRITTWNFDDGKPAGFWSCVECGRKFAPLNVKLEEAARMALDALESLQGGCTDSDDGTVEALTVHCPEVIIALREALGEDK